MTNVSIAGIASAYGDAHGLTDADVSDLEFRLEA